MTSRQAKINCIVAGLLLGLAERSAGQAPNSPPSPRAPVVGSFGNPNAQMVQPAVFQQVRGPGQQGQNPQQPQNNRPSYVELQQAANVQPQPMTPTSLTSPPAMPTPPASVPPSPQAPALLPEPPAAMPAFVSSAKPLNNTEIKSSSQTPTILIEKRGAETVAVGQSLVYEIIIRNVGATPVFNLRIDDEIPKGARCLGGEPVPELSLDRLSWSLGTLEANAERRMRVEVMPGTEGEYRATATATFSATAQLRSTIVRPKLAVTLTGPESAHSGDVVPFAINVTNPGTGPANNVIIRSKLPAGLTHPQGSYIEADIGTLGAGETRLVTLKTTATNGGAHIHEVMAVGDGLEAAARTTILVQESQLQVRRTGPAKVLFKGEIASEIEVTNPGTAMTSNVQLTDTLPAGFELLGASDGAQYDPVTRMVTWRLGSLPPSGKRVLFLKTKAMAVGDQTERIMVTADRNLDARTDGMTAVEGIPALRLEVIDVEDPVEVGGDLVYDIRVINQGSCPCTGIVITATTPDGLTIRDGNGPTSGRVLWPQQMTFDPLPKLATKAEAVYRIRVKTLQPGDYRFKVQLTCEQLRMPVNTEEASRVYKN